MLSILTVVEKLESDSANDLYSPTSDKLRGIGSLGRSRIPNADPFDTLVETTMK
jgi:hypothetical protein